MFVSRSGRSCPDVFIVPTTPRNAPELLYFLVDVTTVEPVIGVGLVAADYTINLLKPPSC
jgi:hypothetical protein